MYSFVIGKVVETGNGEIVLDNNGIGYEIFVSGNTMFDAAPIGQPMKLYTRLYVREDSLALYGFSRREEKTLFERLITISGIGPKVAIQILSGYDLKTLMIAIATSDFKTLSKIKGVGKKTAELICLSLKEQIAEDVSVQKNSEIIDGETSDAVFALVSLGMSRTDAVKAVQLALEKVSGLENVIAYALKNYK